MRRLLAPVVAALLASAMVTACGDDSPQKVDGGSDAGGGTAVLVVTPPTHNFGAVVEGAMSSPTTFTISNTGNAPSTALAATLAGVEPTSFVVTGSTCSGSLAAGTSCTVSVVFKPVSSGMKSATVEVVATGTTTKVSATVSGTGVKPATLAIAPVSHDFGTVPVGTETMPVDFAVTNTGGVPIDAAPVPTTSNLAEFIVKANGCTGALMPGANCVVKVAFKPAAAGVKTATLTAASGSVTGTSALTGTGALTDVTVTPSSQNFGQVLVGQSSNDVTFTVRNNGGAAVTGLALAVNGTNADNFIQGTSTCAATLAAGASCTVLVKFTPKLPAGDKTASLIVSGPPTPVTVGLSGSATSATLSVSPSSLSFGTVVIGTQSGPVAFTVTNSGNTASGSLATQLGGANAAEFAVVSDGCNGNTLAPNASCAVQVRLAPTSQGNKVATLTINGTPGGQVVANISGAGIPSPDLEVTGNGAFGTVVVGQTSTSADITVKNNGGAPTGALVTTLAGTNPGEFEIPNGSNGCSGQVLAPNGTCVISVRFKPTAPGSKAATLTIAGNPGGSRTVGLSGNGIAPPLLVISPTSQDFGSVAQGRTGPDVTFTITNQGGVATSTLTASLAGLHADQFTIRSTNCGALDPAASCQVVVAFSPAPPSATNSLGIKTATLSLTGSGGASISANLVGNAVDINSVIATPSSKDFQQVVVDKTSVEQEFTIENNGAPTTGQITITITGANAADFEITSNTCSALIQGASCKVKARFAPKTGGDKAATLAIVTASANNVDVPLSGKAVNKLSVYNATQLAIDGRALIDKVSTGVEGAASPYLPFGTGFYPMETGTPTLTRSFRLECAASGDACGPFTFGAVAADFTVNQGTCTGTLAAGATCDFTVVFKPLASGAKAATLTITGNAKESVTVALNGTAVNPFTVALDTDPDCQTTPTSPLGGFGDATVGTFQCRSFIVTYAPGLTGASAVQATNALNPAVVGAGSPFAVVGNKGSQIACGAGSLAAGASCSFTVYFTPSAVGAATGTASLTGADNTQASRESVSIELTGNGVAQGAVSVEPGALTFGNLSPGGSSAAQPVAVAVSGVYGPVTVVGPSGPGAGSFTVSGNTCSGSLSAGSPCTFNVLFTPPAGTIPGVKTASIAVAGKTVTLTGTVTSPVTVTAVSTSTVLTGAYDFGSVARNANKSETFRFTNVGAATLPSPLFVQQTGAWPSQLTITSNGCNVALTSTASCDVTVQFAPGSLFSNLGKTFTGTLAAQASNVYVETALTGKVADEAYVEWTDSDTARAFGDVRVGGSSAPVTYTVRNLGNIATGAVTSTANADFGLGGTCEGNTLAAGATCTVTVAFTPTATGSRAATLSVAAGTLAPLTKSLSGTGIGADDVTASPTPYVFATPVAVGQEGTPVEFTLTNPNTGTAKNVNTISFIPTGSGSSNSFTLKTNGCVPLNSGNTCTIGIALTPKPGDTGNLVGTIEIREPGGVVITRVAVKAKVQAAAALAFSSAAQGALTNGATIALGQAALNPVEDTITVTNTGDVASGAIAAPTVTAGGDKFSVVSNTCTGTLAAGASCSFGVRFTATAAGAAMGTLSFPAVTPGTSAVSFNLTGTGYVQAALSIAPADANCGNAALTADVTNAACVFTVSNATGALPTGPISVALTTGTNFRTTTDCTVLGGGQSCTVTVVLSPTQLGAIADVLTVSATPGGSVARNLTANGTRPLNPNVATGTFGATAGGASTPQTFTFTLSGDAGTDPTGVLNTTVSGPEGADFVVLADTCTGSVLRTPGATCTVEVVFVPTAGGSRSGTLTVTQQGRGADYSASVALSGSPAIP